jgi:hypothetical protein
MSLKNLAHQRGRRTKSEKDECYTGNAGWE